MTGNGSHSRPADAAALVPAVERAPTARGAWEVRTLSKPHAAPPVRRVRVAQPARVARLARVVPRAMRVQERPDRGQKRWAPG